MPGDAATRILAEVAANWSLVDASLTRLSDEDLERTTPAGWPAKEMLSHLAFWAEAVEGYVTLAIRLKPLPEGWQFGSGYVPDVDKPWPHFEEHNAREAAWGRAHTPGEVRERLRLAYAGLQQFLATVTNDEATTNEQYFHDVAGHYREHAAELDGLR